jgi:hypothetical protein
MRLTTVDHWLKSPKRDELFGPRGITHRYDGVRPDTILVLAEE